MLSYFGICRTSAKSRISSAGAQPISPKLLKGLGCCPTSFCTSGYRRALLARMVSSGVGTHRICLLFCKKIPGRTTVDFASVHTLAVLAIPTIILHEMIRNEGGLTK